VTVSEIHHNPRAGSASPSSAISIDRECTSRSWSFACRGVPQVHRGFAARHFPPGTVVREWGVVSDCAVTAYDATALHGLARRCQNGVDPKPCACSSKPPVIDRTLPLLDPKPSLLDPKPSILASQHSVIAAKPRVIAVKIKSLEFEEFSHPFEASGSHFEASSRRPEAFSRRLGVFSRQTEASKFGIRSFGGVIRGFRSPAKIDQPTARTVRDSVCGARSTPRSSKKTNQVGARAEYSCRCGNAERDREQHDPVGIGIRGRR
jgi:hypothetical protein